MRLALARAPRTSLQHHRGLQRWSRGFSTASEEKAKGTPYSKLTVGIPRETFPLEKRVAATPEVSSNFCFTFYCALVKFTTVFLCVLGIVYMKN